MYSFIKPKTFTIRNHYKFLVFLLFHLIKTLFEYKQCLFEIQINSQIEYMKDMYHSFVH